MEQNRSFMVLGIVAIALFTLGVIQLFLLRFSTGDIYPPYSSLRSDPLGVKAFYEALGTCCGLTVTRNHEPFERIKERHEAVVFYVGVAERDLYDIWERWVQNFEYFVQNGGRLVIALFPKEKSDIKPDKKEEDSEEKKHAKKDEGPLHVLSLTEEWGFEVKEILQPDGEGVASLIEGIEGLKEPAVISCHSILYFDKLDPAWKTVYSREGHAVVIERSLGKGSIVLSAESYFFSNEAMLRERHPGLLAWLVGHQSEAIFDEYSHGVVSNPGVAALAGRYHLQWLLAGVLVLAVLFIWKNSFSLVPPYGEGEGWKARGLSKGKDSMAGLTNLLRRSIPARNILFLCHEEWKKSSPEISKDKVERINSIIEQQRKLPSKQQHLLDTYNGISRILK